MKESEAISREYMIQGLAKEILLARSSYGRDDIFYQTSPFEQAERFVAQCEERLAPLEDALAARLAEELIDRRDTEPPDGESESREESETEG